GKGYGTYAGERGVRTVALGRDVRLSSPAFRDALAEGLVSTGRDVIDVGICPTPLLYFVIHRLGTDGGVMITGSHKPPAFNGFKLCMGLGSLYGEMLQEVRRIVESGEFRAGQGSIAHREIVPAYMEYVSGNLS